MPKVDGVCGSLPKNVCEMFANNFRKQGRPPYPARHRGKNFKPYGKNKILPRHPQSGSN